MFAKAPVAGRVKTRLTPDLTPAQAAELQEALLLDTGEVVDEAARTWRPPARRWCAVAEPQDEPALRSLLPPSFTTIAQGSGTLGDRLERVFGRLLGAHPGVLALGADCPDLTPPILHSALAALAAGSAVFGEATDGGYWTIGLTTPTAAVFRDMPWSSASLARRTRASLVQNGRRPTELPRLRDIDTLADLRAWAARPNPRFARTLARCRELGVA